jgi:cell division protein FtsA
VEREAVLVGIDVGTSKVCALIGEVSRDGRLTIMGHGTVPASGLKKGVVINIDQTVSSISAAVEQAERLSGWKLESAFVAVGGSHVESQNSRGAVAVSGPRKEVSREDVARATEVARAVTIPSNRDVLHVLPRGYIVDGQEGVKDPIGMSAIRLEVETHIVHASATAVQNLTKCVQQAGVRVDELVAASLASAEAVLSDTEKDLGVAVADIGAGTTDLALFLDGSPFHTVVLPIGGNNVTNDVAIGLKTSLQSAEELKIRHGTCDLRSVAPEELIQVETIGEPPGRTVQRAEMCGIIDARMRELFEKIGEEIRAAAQGGMLPAGVVLTGGGSQLAGVAELGREVLQMPVRVAAPAGVGGLVDHLLTPAFSTSIGLLLWGAHAVAEGEPGRYESAPAGGALGRAREWLRNLFP